MEKIKPEGNLDEVSLPKEGKVTITHMEIRVPVVKYKPNYEVERREQIYKNPKSPISFFDLQAHECSDIVSKRNFELDITNFYQFMEFDQPLFIITAFQTHRKGNQLLDSSQFDHVQLQNMHVKNGRDEIFPEEF